ncbi:hypothetical protein LNP17_14730 [Klebsiella variicola subsp. variicola]|nr:hypothetical protein [Klebsiella variicola subsp. variicola]
MKTVAACRFPPSRLQVEVTESYVLENPERSQAVVENLKAQGYCRGAGRFWHWLLKYWLFTPLSL